MKGGASVAAEVAAVVARKRRREILLFEVIFVSVAWE
jgi:hypothetical protein